MTETTLTEQIGLVKRLLSPWHRSKLVYVVAPIEVLEAVLATLKIIEVNEKENRS